MRLDDHDEDPELSRLLRAVRADADPVLWTRVRARAEARPRAGGLLAWAMRPAALAASLALLIAAAALALMLGTGTGTQASGGDDYATLGEALLAERDAEIVSPPTSQPPAGGAARDSGTRL